MTLNGAIPYVSGLIASGIVGVVIQQVVDRRSAARRAHAESPGFRRLDLAGRWFNVNESTIKGKRVVNGSWVIVRQVRNRLFLQNETKSPENPDGGFLWRGELRIWDNQHLLGWYVAREPNVLSKGTFYYVLHATGAEMTGRWVGRSYDEGLVSGNCCLARTENRAREIADGFVASQSKRRHTSDQ
jgi:hypothetical protein